MKTALLAILLFCVMIFPHELGHFIAAKKMGVKVNEFAFGMGPAIWKRQRGETLYAIRLFPIGGYCAMEGEDEDSPDEGAFSNKKPWQKIIILAAGSFMNVVCAILIMALVLGIAGFTTNVIGQVNSGSPAETAGIEEGDEILAINGNPVEDWNDILEQMPTSEESMDILIERDGQQQHIEVTPQLVQEEGENGAQERYVIGITSKISHSPIQALIGGCQSTWNITKLMFQSLAMLFTGEAGADDLTGPVGMVQMVSQTNELGFWYYGFLTALICVNLAIINMLPLPALDGGRIIFVLFTMITGKKVSERVEGTVHFIGLALLLCLMVYVTFHDVVRIFFNGA